VVAPGRAGRPALGAAARLICPAPAAGGMHIGRGGVHIGVYFMAWIGALVYFLQRSHDFGSGVLAVLKALVWPAILVYEVLKHTLH